MDDNTKLTILNLVCAIIAVICAIVAIIKRFGV